MKMPRDVRPGSIAEQIYNSLEGGPKTPAEWAESSKRSKTDISAAIRAGQLALVPGQVIPEAPVADEAPVSEESVVADEAASELA
jgi:hypothetical protein